MFYCEKCRKTNVATEVAGMVTLHYACKHCGEPAFELDRPLSEWEVVFEWLCRCVLAEGQLSLTPPGRKMMVRHMYVPIPEDRKINLPKSEDMVQ